MTDPNVRSRVVAAGLVSLPPMVSVLHRLKFPQRSITVLLVIGVLGLVALAAQGRPSGVRVAVATSVLAFAMVVSQPGYAPRWVLVVGLLASLGIAAVSEALRTRGASSNAVAAVGASSPTVMGAVAIWHLDSLLAARNAVPVAFGSVIVAATVLGACPLPGTRRDRPGASWLWPSSAVIAWYSLGGARSRVLLVPIAVILVLVALATLVPTAWARSERVLRFVARPADLVLDAFAWFLAQADRIILPAARVVGDAVRVTVLTVVWALAIMVPSAAQRVLRRDPTWAARPTGSRWVPRQAVDARSSSMWIPDPSLASLHRPQARRRNRPMIVAVLAPVVVVTLLVVRPNPFAGLRSGPADEGPGPVTQTAWDGSAPWSAEFGRAMDRLVKGQVEQQYAGLETPDVSSRYLNIRDGWRATWQPPIERCAPRVVVWMFGGSTMFGELQRDDHTLASAIAKEAWSHGVALEVHNGGVHADTSWQEQRRLARSLASTSEAPDLVVFYDGFNDYIVQDFAYRAGMGGEGTFMGMNDSNLMRALTEIERVDRGNSAEWRIPVPPGSIRDSDPAAIVPAALFQYRVTDEQTRGMLGQAGIPFVHLFQPNGSTRTPRADGDYVAPADQVEGFAAMRTDLPKDVIDLSGALDGPGPAVYIDEVHTNEAANPIIAVAAWQAMAPTVASIVPQAEEGSCS